MIITIDGPSASGKSSIARSVAQQLHMVCLSSGSLYRAIATVLLRVYHCVIDDHYILDDNVILAITDEQRFIYHFDQHQCGNIFFDGVDLSPFLKLNETSQAASIISKFLIVRKAVDSILKRLARNNSAVAEGRDMGSVVFPRADFKFFLTASLDVRAERLQRMMAEKNISMSFDQAREHIQLRDTRDAQRTISPLIIPAGAVVIDNSHLSQQETLDLFMRQIKMMHS